MACPYLHKPGPCAKRQKWTTPAPSDCRECDFRGRPATSTEAAAPPVTPHPKPETITPPKETAVPNKMTPKERCLALLTRNGSASPSLMMQRCHVSAGELKGIIGELEQEGKIKAWLYRVRNGMTAIYTLPGAKDPRTPEMVKGETAKPEKRAAPMNDATVASKQARPVNRTPAVKPAPVNGSGPFAAVIADLEARRDAINRALEGLRALA